MGARVTPPPPACGGRRAGCRNSGSRGARGEGRPRVPEQPGRGRLWLAGSSVEEEAVGPDGERGARGGRRLLREERTPHPPPACPELGACVRVPPGQGLAPPELRRGEPQRVRRPWWPWARAPTPCLPASQSLLPRPGMLQECTESDLICLAVGSFLLVDSEDL
ncbi:uncharacterized protein ACOB8E_002082 [Sarcophilus harrisii]